MAPIPRFMKGTTAVAGAAIVAASAAATIFTVSGATSHDSTQAQLTAQALQPGARSGTGHRHAFRLPIRRALVAATAKETGVPIATIRTDLRAGETLDQIAGAKAAMVVNDVLGRVKARLEKELAAGKITKTQQTSLLSKATTRIDRLMHAHTNA